jgi:chemotaxis family two-component system response regulator Rcp1
VFSIFLAEDNPGDVELLRLALDEHRVACELVVAEDGEKALVFLRQIEAGLAQCPQLAIIDLNLPKKSGRDLLAYLRSSSVFLELPIIVLSSSASPKDMAEAAQLGASRYIRKPSSLDEYLQIGEVLKLQIETCGWRP